jgi:hypothetical protein
VAEYKLIYASTTTIGKLKVYSAFGCADYYDIIYVCLLPHSFRFITLFSYTRDNSPWRSLLRCVSHSYEVYTGILRLSNYSVEQPICQLKMIKPIKPFCSRNYICDLIQLGQLVKIFVSSIYFFCRRLDSTNVFLLYLLAV